jgi:hypothetical protein
MPYLQINLLAVVVAGTATFALGGLWYSRFLFGRAWVAALGLTPEQVAERRKAAGTAYAVTLLCWLVMAAAMAVLIHGVGITTTRGGIRLAVLCWLGFAATVGLSQHMFSQRRLAVFLIDTSYQLTTLLAMAAILTRWQ